MLQWYIAGVCWLIIVSAGLLGAASAQTPPAQAQQAQVQPAPSDPAVEQIDADLRSLVASINARLSAINDDVIQLRERMKQAKATPVPTPPATAPGGATPAEPVSKGPMSSHDPAPPQAK